MPSNESLFGEKTNAVLKVRKQKVIDRIHEVYNGKENVPQEEYLKVITPFTDLRCLCLNDGVRIAAEKEIYKTGFEEVDKLFPGPTIYKCAFDKGRVCDSTCSARLFKGMETGKMGGYCGRGNFLIVKENKESNV